jgi:N-hydroxyarylamine O-acetyltransferase
LVTLDLIHALHPAAIPFENLDPLLGLPVRLDHQSLEKKLLSERRGGYCFEQNLLLMAILRELEFNVRGLAARVLWNSPAGMEAPANHMLLAIDIGGTSYIADVGFGGLTLTAPLKLKAEVEQRTPHETYRLLNEGSDWRLEARIGEDWKPLYVFELSEQGLADYEAANARLAGDPASPFSRELRVALSPSGKRIALHDNRLTIHSEGAAAEQRLLSSVQEMRAVLGDVFGLSLPPADLLDPKLEAIVARAAPAASQ